MSGMVVATVVMLLFWTAVGLAFKLSFVQALGLGVALTFIGDMVLAIVIGGALGARR